MRFPAAFILGAATAAIAASAVFAVLPSLGGSGSERTSIALHHHRPGDAPVAATAARRGLSKVRNLEYKGSASPGTEDGYHFKCPRSVPHGVSGYFLPEKREQAGQVQLADSFPSGKGNRNWDVGVFNPTTQPQSYYVGVVCVK